MTLPTLLASGQILKWKNFNSHISFYMSFVSQLLSYWDSILSWVLWPLAPLHLATEICSVNTPWSFPSWGSQLGVWRISWKGRMNHGPSVF